MSAQPMGTARSITPSKPIIPAVIGMFTYGSSSPYALVLCIEHYFDASIRPKPISTHIAAVLALIGSFVWFAVTLAFLPQMLGMVAGEPLGMYGEIGVIAWIATAVFLCWACWRFVRFRRYRSTDVGNVIDGDE